MRALFSYSCKMSVRAILATISEKIKQQAENEAFKTYVTECLQIMTENTAKISGGSYISASLYNILNPKPANNKTGEEIVAEIIDKAGLEVIV